MRGFWTRLDEPWCELQQLRAYPAAVQSLLGEALTASVLLAATLKFQGTLSLQLEGQGPLRLLLAQCTHDFRVRAVADLREGAALPGRAVRAADEEISVALTQAASFAELVGSGRLAVTVEAEERASRSQGIVALAGGSLAACLEEYFASSEQLPTRIALSASATHAAGVLIQKMPAAGWQGEALAGRAQQAWEDLEGALAALPVSTLPNGSAEQLLHALCSAHDARLFQPTPVRFVCRCNRERVAGLLRTLGPREVREVLAEQGAVTVTCEFCGRPYQFDAIDVDRVFADAASLQGPGSLN